MVESGVVDGLGEMPRCVRCRRPFDTHLEDMDRPERGKVYCEYPPSKAEHYIPDREHAADAAALLALKAEVEELRGALKTAERAMATVAEGNPMGVGKNDKCRHGRYGFEGCEQCADSTLDPALESVRAILSGESVQRQATTPNDSTEQLGGGVRG